MVTGEGLVACSSKNFRLTWAQHAASVTRPVSKTGLSVQHGAAHHFHSQSFCPTSLCTAICSLVCRVSTSLRDGLMGCAQSQSLRVSGSVAHPAVETAIKSSIAIVLNVMADLR